LIALAYSKPPVGRAHWTIRLLAKQVVERKIVESALQHGGSCAQENDLKPHLKEYWVIPSPSKSNAGFVAAMEDVLEVYTRPHDTARPFVSLDKQLVAENANAATRSAWAPARSDYEYERNGTASLFMLFAPLEGWRDVKVSARHTIIDYAQVLKELSGRVRRGFGC
jgi:hypothetical protein